MIVAWGSFASDVGLFSAYRGVAESVGEHNDEHVRRLLLHSHRLLAQDAHRLPAKGQQPPPEARVLRDSAQRRLGEQRMLLLEPWY